MLKFADSPSRLTRFWGIALVNLATMAWASGAVLGRWLRADVGPLTLVHYTFGGLILAGGLWATLGWR